ncbi:hypothetical protein N7519_001748 [Penicillium mononematosum]|uniref:uncharacterized protein n=1 Tax=Penicillium mononematosum TaxID=268346 RepID=UPI0025497F08|nr:uncharacterized protein N7519_001748 [Penicillium mononematosum]KAJ6186840.1 hypothetical protein N7519_001748 [Penicillium mononematosum]
MEESVHKRDLRRQGDEQRELKLRFPFVECAAHKWYIRIRHAVLEGEDMELAYTMLDNLLAERRVFTAWRVMTWPTRGTKGLTALYEAAWAGLAGYAAHLLERGNSIEERDACQNTPLYWAASSGHHDVVQLLLDNGADPNAEQTEKYNSLHLAARRNHAAVATLLLAAGVHPLTPKTQAHFKRFLEAVVDINSEPQGDKPVFKYIKHGVVAPNYHCDYDFDEKEDDLTETVFDFFEEAGADFLTQENAGSSLLHLLASKKASNSETKIPGQCDPAIHDSDEPRT